LRQTQRPQLDILIWRPRPMVCHHLVNASSTTSHQ
jgi:hypothetical protein